MAPAETNQHFGKGTIVSAHAQAIQQRRSPHCIAEEQRAHNRICFVENSFRQGMVIVTNWPNLAIGKPKILPLKCITTTDDSVFNGDEVLVVYGISVRWKPARHRVTIEDQIRFRASVPKPLIEIRDCGFMLVMIGLDNDGQSYWGAA